LYPKLIRPSYVIAFGYVGCDTITKIHQSYHRNDDKKIILKNGLDCFIWQTFASGIYIYLYDILILIIIHLSIYLYISFDSWENY
jgi:hypothetical protein